MSALGAYRDDFQEYCNLIGCGCSELDFDKLEECEQKKLLELIKSAANIVQKDTNMLVKSLCVNENEKSMVATINIGLKDSDINLIELSKELHEITSKNEALLI
ncbi:hypothetical protein [uncultured Campylobacter sp.]|uniref:hypothetical protein n=1 Tax=uncultured Campylobacter sp. TaxID=218934 RepID=UPI002621D0DD|nr:hypothetical protein [uncultured Campylobacter sp.]